MPAAAAQSRDDVLGERVTINVVVVGLFASSAIMRWNSLGHMPTTTALVLELAAFAFAGVAGWMGGELVTRLGIGVQDHAHADAPSSLSGRSITGTATPAATPRMPMGGGAATR